MRRANISLQCKSTTNVISNAPNIGFLPQMQPIGANIIQLVGGNRMIQKKVVWECENGDWTGIGSPQMKKCPACGEKKLKRSENGNVQLAEEAPAKAGKKPALPDSLSEKKAFMDKAGFDESWLYVHELAKVLNMFERDAYVYVTNSGGICIKQADRKDFHVLNLSTNELEHYSVSGQRVK